VERLERKRLACRLPAKRSKPPWRADELAITATSRHLSGGRIVGFDAASFNGAQVPRRDYQGTYKLNRDCTGTGNYKDSLGTTVDYVFTVVEEGKEIYL
jgi:hypothetical protein